MFDVSFSELLVIAVVALLVIGPEKLPKVARTVGAFVGRMQRYMAQVKEEVNREMRFEELQKLQQEIKQSVESTEADIKNLAKTPKQKTSKPINTSNKPKAKTSTPKHVKSVTK
jgi:sec-independent protein translocase protein TatB